MRKWLKPYKHWNPLHSCRGRCQETRTDYIWKDDQLIVREDGYESSMQPYFAFKLQALFLTFLFSNKGIGGGLNLSV